MRRFLTGLVVGLIAQFLLAGSLALYQGAMPNLMQHLGIAGLIYWMMGIGGEELPRLGRPLIVTGPGGEYRRAWFGGSRRA